jgi:hypothetical protein
MSKFLEIKKEIGQIIKNSPVAEDPIHSELVLRWVLKLKPDADEGLQIAALAHDIERAMAEITDSESKQKDYTEYKKEHAARSARFIAEMLKQQGYSKEVIEKVTGLVEKHEVGGDEESDILRDADSLAYFEYNMPFYLERNGEEKTKEKIKFMYKRMSDKARALIGSMNFKSKEISELFQEATSKIT